MPAAKSPAASPRAITRLGIARAFQIPQLFTEHTVLQNMLLAAASREHRIGFAGNLDRLAQRNEMEELLALVGCGGVARQIAGTLPEGLRKLLDIAMALALRPRLLLMDEPTSSVASAEKFAVMDMIVAALATRKVTSVFVEHDMDVVTRYAHRVAVWGAGKILRSGTPADVLADPEVIRTVIGV